MRRAFALAFMVLPCLSPSQGTENTDVLLTQKRALLILEPRLVSAERVSGVWLSPTGRFLAAVRAIPSERPITVEEPPALPKAFSLVVWNSMSGVARELQLPPTTEVRRTAVHWFTGTDKAVVTVGRTPVSWDVEEPETWSLLDPSTGSLVKIASVDRRIEDARIGVSPTASIAVKIVRKMETVSRLGGCTFEFQTVTPEGRWGKVASSEMAFGGFGKIAWSPDGRVLQIETHRVADGSQSWTPRVLRFNIDTGEVSDVAGPVATFEKTIVPSDLSLSYTTNEIEGTAPSRYQVTWLLKSSQTTERTTAVVAEHAAYAVMAQNDKYVAIVVNGSLFVRQVIEMSLDQYNNMREAAARAVMVSNAKQAALGLLMFATDNDDTLSGDIDMERDINPYVRNSSILEGFVYTFKGGKLSDVDKPAETELGYIEGPGGRAVAYLDGHVKWIPN